MNTNMGGFFVNACPSALHSSFFRDKEEDGVIDLGLSLKTLHPHPSSNQFVFPEGEGYAELAEWSHMKPELRSSSVGLYPSSGSKTTQQCCDEEAEGVQSKHRWAYLKVNMDGIVVGRKICILDHADYSTLAIQLEDMFGKLCISGLQLFQAESGFSLFYMDSNGNWRPAGDVPWKEFVDSVKRLRIVRKNGTTDLLAGCY